MQQFSQSVIMMTQFLLYLTCIFFKGHRSFSSGGFQTIWPLMHVIVKEENVTQYNTNT